MNTTVTTDFKINFRNECFKNLTKKNLLTEDFKKKVNKMIYNF